MPICASPRGRWAKSGSSPTATTTSGRCGGSREYGLRAERGEHPGEPFDAARACRLVALVFDPRTDELQVEAARISRRQYLAQDALERDVTVAGDEPVRGRERPDRVVADLDEPEAVDTLSDCFGESPLRPAGVHLHAHVDVEPSGEVDRIGERVDEADVDSQRVRVLDRERNAARLCFWQHGRQRRLERAGGLVPREWAGRTGREHEAFGADGGGGVERARDPLSLCVPAGRL